MTRRRRLRRRLLWAGVLFGFVLLYATVSALRVCVWCRDVVVAAAGRMNDKRRKGGSMFVKFSLVAVLAAAAMAFAAPAWADPWGADRLQAQATAAPDWFERTANAAIAQQQAAKEQAQHVASSYPDWFERYVAAHSIREPVGDDHFRDPPDAVAVSATSGTELEWPQLGIALGVGVLLALGLLLAVRVTRVRSLAR